MNRTAITNIINFVATIVTIILFFYLMNSIKNTDSKIDTLNNQIEHREQQNDSISKKLDSIAIKKVEVINRIDNRTTTINNLYSDLQNKPAYDTSLSAAILFLRNFGNKQY